jgi:hypothetical protein
MEEDFADSLLDTTRPFGFVFSSPTPTPASGTLETIGDRDWFQATLNVGRVYEISVNSGSLADPFLRLFDSTGKLIFVDDDGGPGFSSFIPFTPITDTPGTPDIYYIEVSAEDLATGTGTGTYSVQVESTALHFFGAPQTVWWFMNNEALTPNQLGALTPFAVGQYSFGAGIGVSSPLVYLYEALGVAVAEGSVAFQENWNPDVTTNQDFVIENYFTVFGSDPVAGVLQGFLSQLDFFTSIYIASGAFGGDITHIQTLARGAVFGQMLGLNAQIANDINLASTATANLIDDNSVSIVGGSAAIDLPLL